MNNESPLRVENLSMRYRRGLLRHGHQALDSVSLEVGRGQVFGLLGPNGAGKTTLIKVLLGLAVGWSGRAELFGEPANHRAARNRVGYLPESHRLPPYLTGRKTLELFGMMCGRDRRWLRERIPVWLEKVDMTRDADRKIREYSKGMQQRVGLAAALVHEPDLVFLDEPTDGVDPVGRAAIREVIAELRQRGTTVFLNSHLLLEVERMCDQIVILDKGRILKQGSLEQLTNDTGTVRVVLASEPPPDLRVRLAERELSVDGLGLEFLGEQPEVDLVVDQLRAAGCSIRSIEREKNDLEDVFIDLVQGSGVKQ
ncbi:ABC transporter ATP-binding protein [Engelhardtia mirabilis]|uniref:Putative ABC transporter ATP-binding protein YxlF n=1 Tax=Engelhardtia mirabilis TaxID=2528011 RepID=A0A518BQN3_9BACT|nr:putative ABC transporter ATP-binding protein YxlF [Planctomycetes bacterium Pla133]QDV03614.1 putative ABC transporter ATP-binding protein YxlF [Planctomycetes bacterium Pla86]